MKGDFMKFNSNIADVLATYAGGAVCYHRKNRKDGSAVLSLMEYDNYSCICKYCGKIIPKALAFEYKHYLEGSE
jgi:hypothetical protein